MAPSSTRYRMAAGRLGDERPHGRLVAQPGAGLEGVADVVLERVARVEHAGEAALGPRGRTGVERVLGDDQHRSHRDGPRGRRRDPAAPEPSTTTSTCRSHESQPGRPAPAGAIRRHSAVFDGRADLDHPLHRRPRPGRDVGSARRRRHARRASDRSSLSGVIIFMYLQTAARLTGSKIDQRVGLAQLVQHAGLGGHEHLGSPWSARRR